jgi:hypothetical protein
MAIAAKKGFLSVFRSLKVKLTKMRKVLLAWAITHPFGQRARE